MEKGLEKRFTDLLRATGVIDAIKLTLLQKEVADKGIPFVKALLRRGWASPVEIAQTLSKASGIPFRSASQLELDRERAEIMSVGVLRRLHAAPVLGPPANAFAVAAPPLTETVFELQSISGAKPHLVLAAAPIVEELIEGRHEPPPEPSGMERRAAMRFECGNPFRCRYVICDEKGDQLQAREHEGVICNVSSTGGLFEGDLPDALASQILKMKGTGLLLHVDPGNGGEEIVLLAEVRRRMDMSSDRGEIGLRWDPLTEADRRRYRDLLKSLEQAAGQD